MRRSMLVSGLENAARNLRYTDRLSTFELGRVYLPEAGDGVLPAEDRRLSIVLCGPRHLPSFYRADAAPEEMDFFDLKGVVETLFDELGFQRSQIEYRVAAGQRDIRAALRRGVAERRESGADGRTASAGAQRVRIAFRARVRC